MEGNKNENESCSIASNPIGVIVEEINIQEPASGEVRIKLAASGLCHTDWETMKGFQKQA
ncbi:uncharacterized protein METZ01_LOCUS308738, partial [marine metagenome]